MSTKQSIMCSLAAASVLGLLMAGTAQAQPAWKNYGQIKFGMLQPSGGMDDADYGTGIVGSAVYGRYLTDYLIVEGAIEFGGADTDSTGYNTVAGYYEEDSTLTSVGYLVTLKGEVATGPAKLYAGGGVGMYYVTLDSDIDSTRLGDLDRDESDTIFGAHVVAGANFDVTDRFFLGVEGVYRWTDDADINESVGTVPVTFEGDLSGYEVTLTAGFRF